MANPFIGEVKMVSFNFPPKGWAFCDGQLLAIAQNQALFSILGTTYGGNGQTNFALPDLRGRAPMHFGQGPGLSSRPLGERSGSEGVALAQTEMPLHNHIASGSDATGTTTGPANGVWAASARSDAQYGARGTVSMNPAALGATGSNQPHTNMQPYLALRFIIALQGVYPSRN